MDYFSTYDTNLSIPCDVIKAREEIYKSLFGESQFQSNDDDSWVTFLIFLCALLFLLYFYLEALQQKWLSDLNIY